MGRTAVAQGGERTRYRGRAYHIVSSLCEKSAISLTECWISRGKSPWMAILGAKRHGCRHGSDPTALKYLYTFC
ncbi:MAG: hypothetical protein HFI44_02280 [Lachnospiraceae bacterium]|nr:hypothetical protein [Lachnospiraceae bacterium]